MSALRLRRMRQAVADLSAALGGGRHAGIELDGQRLTLLLPRLETPIEGAAGATLAFASGHGRLTLQLADTLVRLLTGIDLPGPQDDVAPAVRQWALQAAGMALPEAVRSLFDVQSFELGESAAPPDDAALALRIAHAGAGWHIDGQLGGSGAALAALLASAQWRSDDIAAPAGWLDRLPVAQPVVLGQAAVSLQQLRELGTDDVLLLAQRRFDTDGAGAIQFGPHRLCGRLCAGAAGWHFTISHWEEDMNEQFADDEGHDEERDEERDEAYDDEEDEEEDEQDEDEGGEEEGEAEESAEYDGGDAAPAAPLDAPPLDQLPLQVSVEAGVLQMRLCELQQLVPGTVLRLEAVLPPLVTLRCNGFDVARGELIEIDGRLAVQVTTTTGARRDDPV